MLHMLLLIMKGMFLFTVTLIYNTTKLFVLGSLSFLIMNSPYQYLLPMLLISAILINTFLSKLTLCAIMLISIMLILKMDNNKESPSMLSTMWKYIIINLELIIKVYSKARMSDYNLSILQKMKMLTMLMCIMLFPTLFMSSHQIFIIITALSVFILAAITGYILAFYMSLFIPRLNTNPLKEKQNNMTMTPTDLFAYTLKNQIDNHPMNALIDENFFDERLRMGEFYMAFPIFFKVETPTLLTLSPQKEIKMVWHMIRWESALSKQVGSGNLQWASLMKKGSPTPESAYSIHTPLIPIFSEELFSSLKKMGLPTMDPFMQPTNWSPYLFVTSFYKWPEDNKKESRINEMEEEDY